MVSSSIQQCAGKTGLPMIRLENGHARAEISLQGGQVLSFQPHGHQDLLFVSPKAHFASGAAIRGGIPVCWPWFGAHPSDRDKPSHGFARLMAWKLEDAATDDQDISRLRLTLKDTNKTRTLFPYRFNLEIVIKVGLRLTVELTTENWDKIPFTITQALHTYFRVKDIGKCAVDGLERQNYLTAGESAGLRRQDGTIRIREEINRVYLVPDAVCELSDEAGERHLVVVNKNSGSTVVWNPWVKGASRVTDLGEDDYRHFLCIESANTAADARTIQPGQCFQLRTEIGLKLSRPK